MTITGSVARMEGSQVSNPIKRKRWATQRVTGNKEQKKRGSILNRFHGRKGSIEKNDSLTNGSSKAVPGGSAVSDGGDEGNSPRRIFFNIPLPDDAKDETGNPLADFGRNKIRTAKYTPLSFAPKNIWFQFHTIANIYFLFVIILAVRAFNLPRRQNCSRSVTDIPNFWCLQSSSWRRPSNSYSLGDRRKRCS